MLNRGSSVGYFTSRTGKQSEHACICTLCISYEITRSVKTPVLEQSYYKAIHMIKVQLLDYWTGKLEHWTETLDWNIFVVFTHVVVGLIDSCWLREHVTNHLYDEYEQ